MKNLIQISGLFLLLLIVPACQNDPFGILSNDPVFDMDLFEQNIQEAIESDVIGYAYCINQNGQLKRSGQDGWARTASNPPEKVQKYNKPMHVASVSKTITAVAVMKLLDEKGLTVDDKIAPYLPSDWVQGPGINNMTFKDLLSHKSGLKVVGTQNSSATRFDSLKMYISQGVGPSKAYNYSNSHFALFRVLIPNIWGVVPWAPGASMDQVTSLVYIEYVKENVLKPIGITDAEVTNQQADATLYYSFPESAAGGGGADSDYTSTCGGFGWHLSAYDLANFLAHMYYDPEFLDPSLLSVMEDNNLGWFASSGDHGTYYNHTGGWSYTNPAPTRGLRTVILNFPNGVQAAVLVNSKSTLGSLAPIVIEAFDNAWVKA